MKFNSIKFKISIFHTAILGVILLVFSCALYFISLNYNNQVDKDLITKARAIERNIQSYTNVLGQQSPEAIRTAVRKVINMRVESFIDTQIKRISEGWLKESQTLNVGKDYIHFFSHDGKEDISSTNLDNNLRVLFMEDLYFPMPKKKMFKTLTYHNKIIRVITYPMEGNPDSVYFIQVGFAEAPAVQQLRNWFYAFIVSFPLILFLTSFVGRRQATKILEPVKAITEMANKITHQDLSARIKTTHFDTDMRLLIESFNDMIARLEKSFKHIEEFGHHVAHELKTPLTIIKGEADLLLRKERSKEEYQRTLRIIIEESERVLRTIEDLLLISKLDYQMDIFKFEEFEFMEFMNEIYEQTRILAVAKNITVRLNTTELTLPLTVKGDRLHLRRLFFNIIDNSLNFSEKGGRVEIKVSNTQAHKVSVTITDAGQGISVDDLKEIHEKSFNKGTIGHGLGLNIAWTITQIHQGEIYAKSQLGSGAAFTVILPAL